MPVVPVPQALQLLVQPAAEEGPVGQAGEGIVQGEMRGLLLARDEVDGDAPDMGEHEAREEPDAEHGDGDGGQHAAQREVARPLRRPDEAAGHAAGRIEDGQARSGPWPRGGLHRERAVPDPGGFLSQHQRRDRTCRGGDHGTQRAIGFAGPGQGRDRHDHGLAALEHEPRFADRREIGLRARRPPAAAGRGGPAGRGAR